MSRNGSGTYTVPNTFVAGTTITASAHNQNWDDVGDEITNSLAIDGQSTMTGQLKAANGTAAAPAITFGSDLDCGLYRASANDVGFAVGGSAVVRVNSSGIDAVAGKVREGGFSIVPAGVVWPYAGTTLPDGFLWPIGQVLSQTTYASLYAAVGTTYDTGGEGAGNFRLPDYRGRGLFGKDDMGGGGGAGRITNAVSGITGSTLGANGGAQSVTLAQANLPNVTLTVTGTVTTTIDNGGGASVRGAVVGAAELGVRTDINQGATYPTSSFGTVAGTSSFSSGATSSINGNTTQTAVNKMPPAIICHFIIKY